MAASEAARKRPATLNPEVRKVTKSGVCSCSRGARRSRARTTRRIRQAMPYVQTVVTVASAVAALIQAIRH